jgi:serralysin
MPPKFIKSIRKDYQYINDWRGFANKADGEGVVLSYNFMAFTPDEPRVTPLDEINVSFARYSVAEQNVVKRALTVWASFANVKFVKSTSQDADIMFGQHRMYDPVEGLAGTLLYDPAKSEMRPTDIWLKSNGFSTSFITTHRGLQTALHEIGHALGLKHPSEGRDRLSADDLHSSIMSHGYTGFYTKPGLYDIATLQSIYGPAQKRIGANGYKIGIDKLIWDGGGVDTVSAASAKAKAYINMNDGSWNWIGRKSSSLLDEGQSWLGHFTQVEKAIGSNHADTIIGNELDNTIRGGAGNDVITGNPGADKLYGGAGRDTFVFKSYSEMGTLDRHDRIMDFQKGDKIDLHRLNVTFLGNGEGDNVLSAGKAGQCYFNTAAQELRFDANGDGVAERAIGLKVAAIVASQLLTGI